jgi:hypothetical protein
MICDSLERNLLWEVKTGTEAEGHWRALIGWRGATAEVRFPFRQVGLGGVPIEAVAFLEQKFCADSTKSKLSYLERLFSG